MRQGRRLQSTSYTATINFVKTEVYLETDYNGNPKDDAQPQREVVDSRVVVRAPYLRKLQEKVTAHVALLDDEDLTDPEKEG